MSSEKEMSPTIAMFQKAHAAMVTLQRIDEQMTALAERRERAQGDLREAQAQLNEEIDRAASTEGTVVRSQQQLRRREAA